MLKCLLCFEFWKAGSYVGYTISYFTHAPWPLSVLSVAHRSGFLLLCLVPKPLLSSRICLLWCMAFLLGTFVKCLFAFEMRTSNRCLEAVGGEAELMKRPSFSKGQVVGACWFHWVPHKIQVLSVAGRDQRISLVTKFWISLGVSVRMLVDQVSLNLACYQPDLVLQGQTLLFGCFYHH